MGVCLKLTLGNLRIYKLVPFRTMCLNLHFLEGFFCLLNFELEILNSCWFYSKDCFMMVSLFVNNIWWSYLCRDRPSPQITLQTRHEKCPQNLCGHAANSVADTDADKHGRKSAPPLWTPLLWAVNFTTEKLLFVVCCPRCLLILF